MREYEGCCLFECNLFFHWFFYLVLIHCSSDSLQTSLCPFLQCHLWHLLLQYQTALHRPHFFHDPFGTCVLHPPHCSYGRNPLVFDSFFARAWTSLEASGSSGTIRSLNLPPPGVLCIFWSTSSAVDATSAEQPVTVSTSFARAASRSVGESPSRKSTTSAGISVRRPASIDAREGASCVMGFFRTGGRKV